MAESVVSSFVNKLSFIIAEEANFLLGVEEQLVLLRDELEWMKNFLRDAEKKRRKIQSVELWVGQIRDLAYDAEDVVDAYMFQLEQRRTRNLVSRIIHFRNKVGTLHRIGSQIQQINTRARQISTCRSEYNLEVSETTQEDMASRRRSVPNMEEIDVVGFQKEIAQVANWLKDEVPQRQVFSIFGMGGLGKTTLARKIYKSEEVLSHFEARAWISVSQEYQVRGLFLSALKQVIISATDDDRSRWEKMETEELKEELCKHLESKRYLVIIDDIWKPEAWEQICGIFQSSNKCSKVILTTRNKQVALHAADLSSHNHLDLRLLNDDESWELFCKKMFWRAGGSCPPELVELGKEIVNKCGGLPLGIVVIGGLLMGKERTPNAWSKVLDSVTWQLSQDSNQCREILTLSYTDLPYYLKSCFLYLGLFPEDFLIQADRLIRLWVAEGFVQVRGEEKLEDVAEDCVEELVQRSMIQVIDRLYHGGPVRTFRVHDLLRDLAISEARKDRFMDVYPNNNNSSTATTRPRRIAIHSSSTTSEPEVENLPTSTAPSKFRSLLVFAEMFDIRRWKSTFADGKRMLRVLDLEGATIRGGLPKEIGKLVFLHYLGLRGTGIESLPTSIGKLVKLQTLDIRLTSVKSLPRSIWKLKNLRHLLLNFDYEKFETVEDVAMKDFGRNLLSLWGSGFIWAILSDVLVKQGCLRELMIYGKTIIDQKICFPSSLTVLSFYNFKFEEDPSDVLGSLPKLKQLSLINDLPDDPYTGRRGMVFSRGQFPQLQFLVLWQLKNLREWRVEDGAIPMLRHLQICRCHNLEKLPDGLRKVTALQKIEIVFMPNRFEERVKENGEDWDIIKHVPIVTTTK